MTDATRSNLDRARSASLDGILGQRIDVLDHGFVRVIDYMGNDAAIVQAARVSYGAGTKSVSDDTGLIRYLLRNQHTSPFEMCELKLHLKMPIFVARQWIRHRTASLNEVSGRYSVLPDQFYVPEVGWVQPQSLLNKQGRDGSYDEEDQETIRDLLGGSARDSFDAYHAAVDESGHGLARELARIVLPLSTYTEFYWKIDLHNLLHFLRLRTDPHAQKEIRAFAEEIAGIVGLWVPATYGAWLDYAVDGMNLSAVEVALLSANLPTTAKDRLLEHLDSSARMGETEKREARAKFNRL